MKKLIFLIGFLAIVATSFGQTVRTRTYFHDLFITGYKPTQTNYRDLWASIFYPAIDTLALTQIVGVDGTLSTNTTLSGATNRMISSTLALKTYIDNAVSSGGSVTSVFGRTGAVVAASGDYLAAQVTNVPASGIAATTVQAAITELANEKADTNRVAGGDVSGTLSSMQLLAGVVGANELASSGVTLGTYGNATNVPQFTVTADGIISSATNVAITLLPVNGDYGDVDITSSGAVWTVDTSAITSIKILDGTVANADLANMATQTFKGRTTAGTGVPEDMTKAQAQAILSVDDLVTLSGVADGAVNNGTFTGTTISDNVTTKAALQALETAVESAGSGVYLPLAGGTMVGNILLTSNKLIGGSTTTSDLFLQTTTGIGTTGADFHLLVGNNGATEAMTILNGGNVGINNNAPVSKLDILGATQTGSGTVGTFLSTQTINSTSGTTAQNSIVGTFSAGAGSASYRPISIAYTINNSGAQSGTATGIYLNATETALNSQTHNLLNLLVGGSSRFLVTNGGAATLAGTATAPNFNATVNVYMGNFQSGFSSSSSGVIRMFDSAETSFNRLQFGGTTSSFPAIKRDGAFFRFTLADTSALTPVFALGRAYDATSWNGSARLVDENSVRDKIEAIGTPPGGSGTTNKVAKWTASTTLGNSSVTDDGSLVTVNPSGQTALAVIGGLHSGISARSGNISGNSHILWENSADADNSYRMTRSADGDFDFVRSVDYPYGADTDTIFIYDEDAGTVNWKVTDFQVNGVSVNGSNYWQLDGNTIGANKSIGSNDAFRFAIETNSTDRIRFGSSGRVYSNASNVTDFIISATDSLLVSGNTIDLGANTKITGGLTVTGTAAATAVTVSGGRLRTSAGANVASAGDLTLGNDGNSFDITGTTTINAITTSGWGDGDRVTLTFRGLTITIKNNTAGGGGTAPFALASGVDFSATQNDKLTIELKQGGTVWEEIARSVN